jgi:hypothetical protein
MVRASRSWPFWGLVLGVVCAGHRELQAQSASIAATATVTQTGLSVGWRRELDFGNVTQGVPATVDPRSASAGKFEIHGTRNAEIRITALLPSFLTRGPFTLPITFGNNSGCHRDRDQQNQCAYYNPANPLIVRIRNQNPPNNTYFVWIGGTVSPSPSQPGGLYTGTITLSVSYTGN